MTRFESTQPLIIPSIVQKPVIITLAKALRLNRYTSENDTNTKNELYINASVCASTNLHAEIKLLREIISTINTIAIAMIA